MILALHRLIRSATCLFGCIVLVLSGCAPKGNGPKDSGDIVDDTGQDVPEPDLCQDVDCGAGTCRVSHQGLPECDCNQGYVAEGLTCVPEDPCSGVVCGVNAFCDLGQCHCLDGHEGNPYDECTYVPTQADLCRAELVQIAAAELGFCEGTDDRPYMHGQPGLWCYDFVAWVYSQSSCYAPTPLYLPRQTVGSLPEGWRPGPGDMIKFTIQHYGMVASLSADGQTITTIEGNVNYCVMSRSIRDSDVEYYGTLENVW